MASLKKKNEAIKYCKSFYQFSLPILSNSLNNIHGTKESNMYWKIILGSWLIRYIEIFYERYSCISNAFKLYPNMKTTVLSNKSFQTPLDTTDFVIKGFKDHYNFQLYTEIINQLNISINDTITIEDENLINNNSINFFIIKEKLRNSYYKLMNLAGTKFFRNSWVFDLGIYNKELAKFILSSKFNFWPMYLGQNYKIEIDKNIRLQVSQISIVDTSDEFTKIFFHSLKSNIPKIFLEGYSDLKIDISRKFTKNPKAIFSTNAWYFNDSFKLLAAEMKKKGSKLFAVQHGGIEGVGRYESEENHLIEICDKYFMWGKNEGMNTKIQSIPSPKLSSYTNYNNNNKSKYILFVNTSFPDYTFVLHSSPLGGSMWNYVEAQFEFFNELSEPLRKLLIYRKGLRPTWYKKDDDKKIIENFPEIKLDNHNTSFIDMLKKSRIAIIDNRQTTYIEAFIINHPVILFWNQDDWEIRSEAKPYFKDLVKAGILHYSPFEAAKKLESVYKDPQAWWQSKSVQAARNSFVNGLANSSNLWKDDWINIGKNVRQNLFD